jgi:hypothetical protein
MRGDYLTSELHHPFGAVSSYDEIVACSPTLAAPPAVLQININHTNYINMKKITLSFILCFVIIVSAKSQSLYLENGQNGLEINGGFSTNNDISGFGGGVGYSFSGVFDLGISVGRFGFDQQLLGEDLNATTISPFASYLIIKQNEKIPVSFALNGSYQRIIYSNKVLRENNMDMNGNSFTIGSSLYCMFVASEAMKIQPSIGFNYITGKLKLEDSAGSYTESFNTTVFTLGMSLIFLTSPTNTFVVSPTLSFGDDVTTFGISLGFVFPQN